MSFFPLLLTFIIIWSIWGVHRILVTRAGESHVDAVLGLFYRGPYVSFISLKYRKVEHLEPVCAYLRHVFDLFNSANKASFLHDSAWKKDLEKVGITIYLRISKNLLISKSFIMVKSRFVSPFWPEMWALKCIFYPILADCWLVGVLTAHRADLKQARGHV